MAKSKYVDVDLKKISYLVEVQGYNHKQLIEYLGISKNTFYKWLEKYSDFSDTIKKSKIHLVEEVKNNLIKKTEGFYVTEWKEVIVDGRIVKVETQKYIPPSDTAIIFALANLDPKNWKRADKVVEEDSKTKVNIKHSVSKEEIAKRIDNDDF